MMAFTSAGTASGGSGECSGRIATAAQEQAEEEQE